MGSEESTALAIFGLMFWGSILYAGLWELDPSMAKEVTQGLVLPGLKMVGALVVSLTIKTAISPLIHRRAEMEVGI